MKLIVTKEELKALRDPIHEALATYRDMSSLKIDVDAASELEPTPELVNSGRSATEVKIGEEVVGKLFVVAFKPKDGTGSEADFKAEDLVPTSSYPRAIKTVPRVKSNPAKPANLRTHHEGALSIVRQKIDDIHADPELFGGTFDLLGLDGKLIKKIGELGHAASFSPSELTPLTTLTVGYHTGAGANGQPERFGDPHAVYNSSPDLQVVAFLGVMDDVYQAHGDILKHLNPQEPRGLVVPKNS